MNIRLMIATGLALIAVAPNVTLAVEDALKKSERAEAKAEKKEAQLARKCAHEDAKDLRDADRGRKHPRRDNKWDERCAPPPPPPPVQEPVPVQQPIPEPPPPLQPVPLP